MSEKELERILEEEQDEIKVQEAINKYLAQFKPTIDLKKDGRDFNPQKILGEAN